MRLEKLHQDGNWLLEFNEKEASKKKIKKIKRKKCWFAAFASVMTAHLGMQFEAWKGHGQVGPYCGGPINFLERGAAYKKKKALSYIFT